jgi:citrate lyase subunit beta / citryl-CoA lyase
MTNKADYRPRRSCLYMPGANARALEKAASLPADTVILDLEDAVAPDAKEQARSVIMETVSSHPYGNREVIIRINGLDTPWGYDDLAMAAKAGADGILVPKVVSAEQVEKLDTALSSADAAADMGLWVMIEMPLAILNISDIAAASQTSRLSGFVMGTNDLAKEMNAIATADRAAFQVALALTLTAARAYGLVAIDGVYNDFRDEAGLIAECEQGRMMGFDGKTLIHPAQLDATNRVYSPDPAEVTEARAIIAAFELPENAGKGVIKLDGKMVELLHLEQAKRLVAIDAMQSALS